MNIPKRRTGLYLNGDSVIGINVGKPIPINGPGGGIVSNERVLPNIDITSGLEKSTKIEAVIVLALFLGAAYFIARSP